MYMMTVFNGTKRRLTEWLIAGFRTFWTLDWNHHHHRSLCVCVCVCVCVCACVRVHPANARHLAPFLSAFPPAFSHSSFLRFTVSGSLRFSFTASRPVTPPVTPFKPPFLRPFNSLVTGFITGVLLATPERGIGDDVLVLAEVLTDDKGDRVCLLHFKSALRHLVDHVRLGGCVCVKGCERGRWCCVWGNVGGV